MRIIVLLSVLLILLSCSAPSSSSPAPTANPQPTEASIDSSVYLDDRSDPVAVLRSFYNALNRREYIRAYSYWNEPSLMTPLADFVAQYEAIQSVTLATGTVQGETEAGQRYYFVPVTVVTQRSAGSTESRNSRYRPFSHYRSPPLTSNL
jgi:hypothetical protein